MNESLPNRVGPVTGPVQPSVSITVTNTIETLRKILIAILAMGLVGVGIELLLLDHTEGIWMKIPLIQIAMSLAVLIYISFVRTKAAVRVTQIVMVSLLLGGLVGTYLHYDGNMEFELEMSPSMAGWTLFKESMTGATPALAPGTLIQFGLLGLACTFRHPALITPKTNHENE